jgi:O-antigen/teichoic acid export membrane protein
VTFQIRTSFVRMYSWLWSTEGSLKNRVLRGGIWLLVADGLTRVAGALKMVLLARLLAPHDFGLMAVAISFLSGFEYFTQTGLTSALIQKPGEIQSYLNTVWTLQMIRGAVVAGGLCLAAPVGAWFFDSQEVIPVLRAIALVSFIRGFGNPAVIYLRKELDFRRDVLWRQGGVGVSLFVAILLAFLWRNVWALVISAIAGALAETALSFWVKRFNSPCLELQWKKAQELTRFGKWIFWSNVVTYISLYADTWVVGRFLGTGNLGYYQMAQQLGSTPTSQVGMHVAGVTFPAFSKLQNPGELRSAFLRSLRLVYLIVLPVGCFVSVFAAPVVRVFLGPQWIGLVPALRILSWVGVLVAIGGVTGPLLQAIGKPNLVVLALLLKIGVLLATFYPCLREWGVAGVAFSMLLAGTVNVVCQYLVITQMLAPCDVDYARAAGPGILVSVPPVLAGMLLHFWPSDSILVVGGAAAAAVCLCGALAIRQLKSILSWWPQAGATAST